LDAIHARKYKDHVLVGAAQVMGKTEILLCVLMYYMHADPSPILVKYPKADSAEAFSKTKLSPGIAATPVLHALLGDQKSRDGADTILHKKFPGGFIRMVGANSPSSLRQTPCRIVIQDEISADEASSGGEKNGEGDPVELADARAESYGNRVLVKASTPTVAGRCRAWSLLEKSTFHEWHAKCHGCGEHHVLALQNLHWPSEKDGAGRTISERPQEAWYSCPACGIRWTDTDRQRAIYAGKPIARNPDADTFGFHVGGLYKLIGSGDAYEGFLHEFAHKFLKQARGDLQAKKVYRNTFEAMPWEEEELEKLDKEVIAKRTERYDPDAMLPPGVLRIEAGVDVQETGRLECEFVGYGADEETWGLGYHVIHGDVQRDQVWTELDALLAKTFPHPCGKRISVTTTFVDSGSRQDRVMQFTKSRRSRGIYACKGHDVVGKPIPILPRKPSINNKGKVPQWVIGTNAAKTVIYSRLMAPVPGPGAMHYPVGHGYDDRYFNQLTTERRVPKYKNGRLYYVYSASNRRNEPLDIRVYALAAHRRMPFDAVALAKELATPTPTPSAPGDSHVSAQTIQPERDRSNSNWKQGTEPITILATAPKPAQAPSPRPLAAWERPQHKGTGEVLFRA
jgi:phage terminase large subunit GpA-like protein